MGDIQRGAGIFSGESVVFMRVAGIFIPINVRQLYAETRSRFFSREADSTEGK